MRWLLLLAVNFVVANAIAQSQSNNLMKKLKQTDRAMGRTYSLRQPYVFGSPLDNPQNTHDITAMSKEQMVKTLPQDNMPCIVPNMELFMVMPNVLNSSILRHPIDRGIYAERFKLRRSPATGEKQ